MFNAQSGFANLFPRYSPDGTRLAFVSTKDGDYFSQSSLYVRDLSGGEDKHLVNGVRTAPSWSPDGRKLYYAKSTRSNPHWSLQFDIYVYDLDTEEEDRITEGARALSPAVSRRFEVIVVLDVTAAHRSLRVPSHPYTTARELQAGVGRRSL